MQEVFRGSSSRAAEELGSSVLALQNLSTLLVNLLRLDLLLKSMSRFIFFTIFYIELPSIIIYLDNVQIRNKKLIKIGMLFNNMKNIRSKLINLFKEGYCTPQIARIARTISEPSATIHYNIKKLEKDGAIRTYKAVFDHGKIDEGFCVYLLVKLTAEVGSDPDMITREMAGFPEVESADLLAGQWDIILKIRVKDQEEYYRLLKQILAREGIQNTMSMISLKQLKSELVLL